MIRFRILEWGVSCCIWDAEASGRGKARRWFSMEVRSPGDNLILAHESDFAFLSSRL